MPRTRVEPEIKRRLALAVCRGDKQTQVVNELLTGRPVVVTNTSYLATNPWYVVGLARCSWSSFRALKHRLVGVGFVFEDLPFDRRQLPDERAFRPSGQMHYYIKMTFPEEGQYD